MLAARRARDEQVTAQDLAVSSVLHLTRMKTLSCGLLTPYKGTVGADPRHCGTPTGVHGLHVNTGTDVLLSLLLSFLSTLSS